jgi:dihydroorotate dehydrogenase electron transfer subunit
LELHAPALAAVAQPGQFVHVRCTDGWNPLLRRPLSLHDADPDTGRLTLLVGEFGQGTHLLRHLPPGAELDVLGPLGRGWRVLPTARTVALVGGGVGIPPLHFLAKRLLLSSGGGQPLRAAPTLPSLSPRVIAVIGARSREEVLCEKELADYGAEVRPATDDGSYGFHGTAVDLLAEVLRREPVDQIFTCGPQPMMRGVAALAARHDIPCQVSLEERMACGLGVCLSCVAPFRPGGASPAEYQRICTEGPVFEAREVFEVRRDGHTTNQTP